MTSLNSNEIRLLLSELPLEGSYVQKVTEHDWRSFTLSMYHREEKAWLLHFEIGTKRQRFCRTGIMRKKSKNAQRFTQYLRANLVGCKVTGARQVPGERVFCLDLLREGEAKRLWVRLFSGVGANIFVTDENNVILEALLRRPGRGEEKGGIFDPGPGAEWDEGRFPVREWSGESFNSYVDRAFDEDDKEERTGDAIERIEALRDKELSAIRAQISQAERRARESEDYAHFKDAADLLSASLWKVRKGDSSAVLESWDGGEVAITLDPTLSPSENLQALYQKYKRGERIHESALADVEALKAKLSERTAHYESLLAPDGEAPSLSALEKAAGKARPVKKQAPPEAGLRFESGGFEILVGRNARENDVILRKHTRGSDLWLHTRDHAGGYVIIKAKKDKSVPLEVLLDAANLAIHYSKAKSSGVADLYYTQVKYLRRAKDGPLGLVLPTNEKNLRVTLDENRTKQLLLRKEER